MPLLSIDDIAKVYDEIKENAVEAGCSVLILVAADCDAVCAARILTALLTMDSVSFALRPVRSFEHILTACRELVATGSYRSVVFLNCAGVDALTEEMQSFGEGVTGYILDCHRPIYHKNVKGPFPLVVLDSGIWVDNSDIPSDGDSELDLDYELDDDDDDEEDDHREQQDDDNDDDDDDSLKGETEFEYPWEEAEDPERDEDAEEEEEEETVSSDKLLRRRKRNRPSASTDPEPVEPEVRASRGKRPKQPPVQKEAVGDVPERSEAQQRRQDRARRAQRWRSYYASHFFAAPTSFVVFMLAKGMRRERNDLLWLAILGVTDFFLQGHHGEADYSRLLAELLPDVTRFNPAAAALADSTLSSATGEDASLAGPLGCIVPSTELRLPLLRHWSLMEALQSSMEIHAHLGTWESEAGRAVVRTMMASLGISLRECQQPWVHMSNDTRTIVRERLPGKANDFGVTDLCFASFTRQIGFDTPWSASDVVLVINALLEAGGDTGQVVAASAAAAEGDAAAGADGTPAVGAPSRAWVTAFHAAFAALGPGAEGTAWLERGLALAKRQLRGIARLCPRLMGIGSGGFAGVLNVRRLDDLPDSDVRIFTQPYALAHLGRAVMYAQRVTARVRRLENKSLPPGYGRPFLLCARDPTTSLFTVVGLPFEEDPRSTATRTFVDVLLRAAQESHARFIAEGFDSTTLWVDADHIETFLTCFQVNAMQAGMRPGGGFSQPDDDVDDGDDGSDDQDDPSRPLEDDDDARSPSWREAAVAGSADSDRDSNGDDPGVYLQDNSGPSPARVQTYASRRTRPASPDSPSSAQLGRASDPRPRLLRRRASDAASDSESVEESVLSSNESSAYDAPTPELRRGVTTKRSLAQPREEADPIFPPDADE